MDVDPVLARRPRGELVVGPPGIVSAIDAASSSASGTIAK